VKVLPESVMLERWQYTAPPSVSAEFEMKVLSDAEAPAHWNQQTAPPSSAELKVNRLLVSTGVDELQ
jgi:hypothetical protein